MSGMQAAEAAATEDLEIDLLLEAVYQRYGVDFRGYERTLVRERLRELMRERDVATVSALQEAVLHTPGAQSALVRALSVRPAPLFDDPEQARLLRIATATLRSSPVPKVWLAECAGPESAWALAILLAEEQVHERTEIYATMSCEEALADAANASIPVERLDEYQENYLKSGGTANLAGYFDIQGKRAVLVERLRRRITWSQYSLVTDASPNEFQLIICRRALADFGPVLRQRVLKLFHDSLALFGVIGIDRPFTQGEPLAACYQPLFPSKAWYKRVS